MARAKGDGRGRLGGRAKGTPNKATAEIRENIRRFVEENYETFSEDWKEIQDKEKKCKIFIDLMKFVVPALSSIELNDKEEKDTASKRLREMRDRMIGDKQGGA